MTEPVIVEPQDQYNRELVKNVHPADWKNPQPADRYNMVVIGAGTAGLVTAAGTAGLGGKVAIVDRHLYGGDCLNMGCVPSKAVIRAARAYSELKRAHEFGVNIPDGATLDFGKVMERMRRLRAKISHHDSVKRFSDMGIDVFIGDAEFIDGETVKVGDARLKFSRATIATGARAAAPPIKGLKETGFLTNESIFSLTELPRRFAFIGGGPIGCEMAQSFARFGSHVFLLDMAPHLLPREDADAAERVQKSMVEDGVELVLKCGVKEVRKSGDEKIVVVECGDETREIVCDEIMVGIGRAPNVQGLGLEAAGVEYDERQGVKVDDHLQTANPKIYAAGDICSPYKFTHTADAMARIVIQNALFGLPFMKKKVSALTIPWCTYTSPEIAHVGLYADQAREQGIEVDTFVKELNEVDRAVLDGEDEGFVKVHVQKGKDRIVGATIVAEHAGEMISEIGVAMAAGAGLATIAATIHPYPTQAEAIKMVGDAYARTRLTPTVKSMFEKWLAWKR